MIHYGLLCWYIMLSVAGCVFIPDLNLQWRVAMFIVLVCVSIWGFKQIKDCDEQCRAIEDAPSAAPKES